MKLAVIIQARMGSKRLPGKVMMEIGGCPILGHIIDTAKVLANVIVATPDWEIAEYAWGQCASFFIGDEDDVLDRYYQTAKAFEVVNIIRLTADNPLIRPETIWRVVSVYASGMYDWVGNCRLKTTYPIGDDVEVFSFKTLERAWQEATEPYDRECVTSYIYNHPELFELGVVENEIGQSHISWTVDTKEDFEKVQRIFEKEVRV